MSGLRIALYVVNFPVMSGLSMPSNSRWIMALVMSWGLVAIYMPEWQFLNDNGLNYVFRKLWPVCL